MVSILLLILKIILYIILGLLALLLLILLLVLFVPIKYEVSGEKYEQIKVNAKVSWLLKIFRVYFRQDKEMSYAVKVFWKTIISSVEEVKDSLKDAKNVDVKVDEIKKEEEVIPKEQELAKLADKPVDKVIITKESNKKTTEEIDKEPKKKTKKKIKKKAQKKSKKKTKKDKDDKGTNILSKLKDVKAFFENDEYKGAIKFILGKILKVVKSVLPKELKIKALIGTGDPAMTGYIIGAVSMLYAVTKNSLKVTPDFHEKVFEGEFYVKGRIFLFIIVLNGVKIILDKRARKLILQVAKGI